MENTPIIVRPAVPGDLAALLAFDELHVITPELLAENEIYVAVAAGVTLVGYARFNHTFFWRGWVATLVVHPDHRRRGLASTLLRHVESICKTRKVFVSTGLFNIGMQAVLAHSGYKLTGVIEDLGPTPEPELFYFKMVQP